MRKLLPIFLSSTLFALPMGNPATASLIDDEGFFSWDAGFYGSYVFNRHMYTVQGGNTIQTFHLNTNAGMLTANIWNRADIFATFGASNLGFYTNADKLRPADYSLKGQPGQLYTNDAFSWSIGGNATLFNWTRYTLGFEGQYFRTKPKIQRVLQELGRTANPDRTATYSEWQLGAGLSYYMSSMVFPYLGLSWSRANADFGSGRIFFSNGTSYDIPNMRNERQWAYSAGVTLSFYEQMNCTIEGRFSGERGVFVNGSYHF